MRTDASMRTTARPWGRGSSVPMVSPFPNTLILGALLAALSSWGSSPGGMSLPAGTQTAPQTRRSGSNPAIQVRATAVEVASGRNGDSSLVSNPGDLGPYAIGHSSYMLADPTVYARSVFVGVWYPVDSRSVGAHSPLAQYPLDPWTTMLPVSTSGDWERFGVDRAYEGLKPARPGHFPLLLVSPGLGVNYWFFIQFAVRVASHGFVVAVVEHNGEYQWPWSPGFNELTEVMVRRPADISFAITQLLEKSGRHGELLFGAIDPDRIAMAGHSIGGYTAFALAGGDDRVCDTLWASNYSGDTLPEPASTCVPILPDRRIRAIVTMDGSSQLLRYEELARVEIPSLILGQTVENTLTLEQNIGTWIARPHSAIGRRDSYRVDILGGNHYSYTDICEAGWEVLDQYGVLESVFGIDLPTILTFFPCASTGFDPVTIAPVNAHQIVATYTVAFLQLFLKDADLLQKIYDAWVLTPEFAKKHEPDVYFFRSEQCDAALPGPGYFTYWVTPGQCDTWPKNPPDYFAP